MPTKTKRPASKPRPTSKAAPPSTVFGGADPLPPAGAPTPPAKESPVAVNRRKGARVFPAEVNLALRAANELRGSTVLADAVGTRLGTAEQIADTLTFAASWYREAQRAATWQSYAQLQSNLAWIYALALIERLRRGFQASAASDPGIATELPNFTKLLGVRQSLAAKAWGTRRKMKSGELVVKKRTARKGT